MQREQMPPACIIYTSSWLGMALFKPFWHANASQQNHKVFGLFLPLVTCDKQSIFCLHSQVTDYAIARRIVDLHARQCESVERFYSVEDIQRYLTFARQFQPQVSYYAYKSTVYGIYVKFIVYFLSILIVLARDFEPGWTSVKTPVRVYRTLLYLTHMICEEM